MTEQEQRQHTERLLRFVGWRVEKGNKSAFLLIHPNNLGEPHWDETEAEVWKSAPNLFSPDDPQGALWREKILTKLIGNWTHSVETYEDSEEFLTWCVIDHYTEKTHPRRYTGQNYAEAFVLAASAAVEAMLKEEGKE